MVSLNWTGPGVINASQGMWVHIFKTYLYHCFLFLYNRETSIDFHCTSQIALLFSVFVFLIAEPVTHCLLLANEKHNLPSIHILFSTLLL